MTTAEFKTMVTLGTPVSILEEIDERRCKMSKREFSSRTLEAGKFDHGIRRFDAVMDHIQKVMPEDLKVWERIAEVRDAVFGLQQQLRGCEIEVFSAPWIDPDDIGFPYESPVDIFGGRREEEEVEENEEEK